MVARRYRYRSRRFATRLIAATLAISVSASASAQVAPARPPVGSSVDPAIASRLVWWAMAALDQANQTGNYSVLRDLGVPAFQAGNSAATLATTFQNFRAQNLDLGATLNTLPTFEFAPVMVNGILRARGVFPLRPTPFGFDIFFQYVNGRWALVGISVIPLVQVQSAQKGSTR